MVWEQFGDAPGRLRRQTLRDVPSFRPACGSCPFRRAECTWLMLAAARLPARRHPANCQLLRPIAIGPIWFSTELLSAGQFAVLEVTRQRRPAGEGVVRSP